MPSPFMRLDLEQKEDKNKNFIPDSWEKRFKWVFTGKSLIMFLLGLGIGF
ncbi:hypothetical protein OAQ15_04660 [Flavobacteriaceae bacterium]|nr:hypothetical protein [Flavobacteriaceae bacterium]